MFMLVFAYIDPGAGSLALQALIAAIIAIPYFFRTAIRSALQRLRRVSPADEGDAQPEPD
jgi:hypothetical protein